MNNQDPCILEALFFDLWLQERGCFFRLVHPDRFCEKILVREKVRAKSARFAFQEMGDKEGFESKGDFLNKCERWHQVIIIHGCLLDFHSQDNKIMLWEEPVGSVD